MNNFDMPTQLDVINFHNTHDTLCVPKGMTLKQLVEDYDRLNNIINELEKSIKGEYDYCDKRLDPAFGVGMGVTRKLLDKLKELKENNK